MVIDEATGIILSGSGNKLIQPHEALALIDGVVVDNPNFPTGKEVRYALGCKPALNIRTRFIELGDYELSADQLSRLYLQLSNHKQKWSKQMTIDAVNTIAEIAGKSKFYDDMYVKGNLTVDAPKGKDAFVKIYANYERQYAYLNIGKNNTNYWQMFYNVGFCRISFFLGLLGVRSIRKYPNKVDNNDPVNTPILTPSIYCIFSAKAKFPTKRLIVKPIPVSTPTP